MLELGGQKVILGGQTLQIHFFMEFSLEIFHPGWWG